MEVEKEMERLYGSLLLLADKGRLIVFSEVIAGLEKLRAVKTFIVLLFLAQLGRVSLWQEESLSEIYITLGEVQPIGGEGTGIV